MSRHSLRHRFLPRLDQLEERAVPAFTLSAARGIFCCATCTSPHVKREAAD